MIKHVTILNPREKLIRSSYKNLKDHLTEKGRRIWAATEAQRYGHGGTNAVQRATSISRPTIKKGINDLSSHSTDKRVRSIGGGRKKLKNTQPQLIESLHKLLSSSTRGDPESPLLWTSKSSYKLASSLQSQGFTISRRTVDNLLHEEGYSLQSNKKKLEGKQSPDRDAQFNHINSQTKVYQAKGCPVLSIDTKKKENIGNYKNNGNEYSEIGHPIEVNTYDFPDKELGKVSPYGVYDIGRNEGWVNVGISSDTAAFAVHSIRTWWYGMGKSIYNNAESIMITADCGGSNGYRTKLWKVELQKLATEIKKTIHVCHFPPGTSKWNKIEHKMFSYISMNWRGKPLISVETVVNLITNTTTTTGLTIQAVLDKNYYEKGIKISEDEFKRIKLEKHSFHGEWNYSITPH